MTWKLKRNPAAARRGQRMGREYQHVGATVTREATQATTTPKAQEQTIIHESEKKWSHPAAAMAMGPDIRINQTY